MVVVFGTVCLDRVHRVPFWPQPGGYAECGDEQLVLGGEAANTALALKEWGAEFELYGNALGSDLEAEIVLQKAHAVGLPTNALQLIAARTPVCDIYVTPEGERSMIGRGFSQMDDYTLIDSMQLYPGEWFTAEPNCATVSRNAVRKAISANMKLYLMDFIHEDEPITPGSYWQSSTDWAGVRNDADRSIGWAKEWSIRYRCHTIITDGDNGLYYCSPEGLTRLFPAFPCPLSVDSTGAGDTFRAGVLYGLDQGWSTEKSLRFGSAAGCLACGYIGATTTIPSVAQVNALIAAHPEICRSYA
jgi:sugar/nucleoside kinase (ribokinase family)